MGTLVQRQGRGGKLFCKKQFVLFVTSKKVREVVARTVQEVLEPPAHLSDSATGYWWDRPCVRNDTFENLVIGLELRAACFLFRCTERIRRVRVG